MKHRSIYQQETRGLLITLVLTMGVMLFKELFEKIAPFLSGNGALWLTALFATAILVIACVFIMYRRVSKLKKKNQPKKINSPVKQLYEK